MPSLSLRPDDSIVFLTGAGVSVASGIRPFRGPGGIWNELDPEEWASKAALERDPVRFWQLHAELAKICSAAEPNLAHQSLAKLERRLPNAKITLITQNVDSLHQRAGSTVVLEIHGSLARLRCPSCSVRHPFEAASAPDRPPPCPSCGHPLRFDVVAFEELLPLDVERAARNALRAATIFIAVGTSGVVMPAAGYAREAAYAGARTVLINLEAPDPPNPYFQDIILGRAEDLLPTLLEVS
jgi:NAD-dependent deacetylase